MSNFEKVFETCVNTIHKKNVNMFGAFIFFVFSETASLLFHDVKIIQKNEIASFFVIIFAKCDIYHTFTLWHGFIF